MNAENSSVEETLRENGEREALRASEARYRALATASADVIYLRAGRRPRARAISRLLCLCFKAH